MEKLSETNAHFKAKGATHYHDSYYPNRYAWETMSYTLPGGLFSRHYFKGGVEIGYVIPDLLSFEGHGVHEFETPRVWGIPHTLHELA